jgi:hypothetical protein
MSARAGEKVVLVDLLDRLMAGGVVLTGDLTLSIAEVDLVQVGLRAIIRSVDAIDSVDETSPSLPEGHGMRAA